MAANMIFFFFMVMAQVVAVSAVVAAARVGGCWSVVGSALCGRGGIFSMLVL
jgi:hypothetical protein